MSGVLTPAAAASDTGTPTTPAAPFVGEVSATVSGFGRMVKTFVAEVYCCDVGAELSVATMCPA